MNEKRKMREEWVICVASQVLSNDLLVQIADEPNIVTSIQCESS